MERHDPFKDPRFPAHEEWLVQLDPGSLRHFAYTSGLINEYQRNELDAITSPNSHNSKFLSFIKITGQAGFKLLLEVIPKVHHLCGEKLTELKKLCQPQEEQGAAASQPAGSSKGETNPFESDTYLKKFPWLVEHLDPTLVRLKCAAILTPSQRKTLKERESTSWLQHNEELLNILESGGKDSYHHLILILEDMKGMFPTVAAELKAAL